MDHFWSTCNAECESALLVRYYVDGEEKASIEFEPGMAAGTGFDDIAAPWGECERQCNHLGPARTWTLARRGRGGDRVQPTVNPVGTTA